MLKRKTKIPYETEKEFITLESYHGIIRTAESGIRGRKPQEQVMFLEYIISSVLDEICAVTVNELVYKKGHRLLNCPFPAYCFDESGNKHDLLRDEKVNVCLSDAKVYIRPWNTVKLIDSLVLLKDICFEYDEHNHESIYFSDINLCYVFNGNHSINAGRYFKKGEILSNKYDMKTLFYNCTTDGIEWYNAHTNQRIQRVDDFRFAVVFTLAKIRYNIMLTQRHA